MEASESVPKQSPVAAFFRRILSVPELSVLFALAILVAVFTFENKAMVSSANIQTVLRTMSYTGIIAIGQTFLIIAGEIDLSVGGVGALASGIAAALIVQQHWPWQVAVPVVFLAGIGVGLFNGFVTVKLRVPAFVATLAMMFVARGLGDVLTNGTYIWGFPEDFTKIGKATPLGMSWSFWFMLVLVIVGDFILRQSIFGSMVTATGGNKQAARVTGIKTDWVKIACFTLTATLATLSGLLATASLGTGDSHIFPSMELDSIASSVIGGVSLFGGVGSIIGTFLGTLVLNVIRSGLIIAGVNIDWQLVAVGTILAAAASIDLLRRRAKKY